MTIRVAWCSSKGWTLAHAVYCFDLLHDVTGHRFGTLHSASARQPAHRRSHVATLTASWLASTCLNFSVSCLRTWNSPKFWRQADVWCCSSCGSTLAQRLLDWEADAWPAIECEGPEKRWWGGLLLFDGHDSFGPFNWTPESEHPLLHIPLLDVHGQGSYWSKQETRWLCLTMYGMRTVLQPLIPGFQEMNRFAEMQKKTPAPRGKELSEVELTTLSGSKEAAQTAEQAVSVRLCWYKWFLMVFWIFEAPPSNFAILAIFGTSLLFPGSSNALQTWAFKEVLKRGNTIDLQLGLVLGRIKLATKWSRVRARAMTKPYTSHSWFQLRSEEGIGKATNWCSQSSRCRLGSLEALAPTHLWRGPWDERFVLVKPGSYTVRLWRLIHNAYISSFFIIFHRIGSSFSYGI